MRCIAIPIRHNHPSHIIGGRQHPIKRLRRRLDRRQIAGVTVFLRELLDATPADVVPIGDIAGIEIVVNCEPTDSVNIILFQLHRMTMLEGVIIPTKSFPDWT